MVSVARATNTGIFLANSSVELNEVSYSGIRFANNYIYSTEFNEITNLGKSIRLTNDGRIFANNYFSEITNINDGAAPASSYISSPSTFVNAGVVANTPFASGNSYSFGGNNTSYITIAGNSAFAYGTGDFTIEWFQFETDNNGFPRTFYQGTGTSVLAFDTEASFGVLLWYGGTYGNFGSVASFGTYKNIWVHIALVRRSGVVRLYKNGVLFGSALSVATNYTDSTSTFFIGARGSAGLSSEAFGGRITNFRVVKGLGVYTGNFTVPTSALTAVASANPYGGANTSAITNQTVMLLTP